MLKGRFGNTSGRPYLEGRLYVKRLNIRADVSFLVDTGSDVTCLHPIDGIRVNLDYSQLTGDSESIGTSGLSHSFVESAFVVFSEPKHFLYVYRINLHIAPVDPEIMTLPSILGRDILDRWRMTYSPQKNNLVFKVLSADMTLPIP